MKYTNQQCVATVGDLFKWFTDTLITVVFYRQVTPFSFLQRLLKHKEIAYMLGTIFSATLIHIWCSSEY